MSKFNTTGTRPAAGAGPIVTDQAPSGHTYEGAPGYARDLRSELFLLAVSNMVGEGTSYERAGDRDDRYAQLVRQVAVEDVAWLTEFVRWLRNGGNMRSASLVAAAEAIKGRLEAGAHGDNRPLVDACMARADEPGEFVAYWRSRFGRALPQPVKNGLGDAARRLYTERSVLKYDTPTKGYRFADVIELVRPEPADADQDALFEHLLARRHNRDELFRKGRLPLLRARAELDMMPADQRRELLAHPERLRAAGMTWEALSAWLGKLDRAAWEAIIPSMPYMALLRNLRNFDQAGVSDATAAKVAERMADPEQVARSRQFPFRFLAAYRNAPSLRWGHALDKALTLSLGNVPELDGRTLILVDRSGSMFGRMSGRSELDFADSAAIFGAALAMRNAGRATLVQYGTGSQVVDVPAGGSLLKVLDRFEHMGGTETAGAVRRHYTNAHDQVVIVTDEQAWAGYGNPGDQVPAQVPVYTFNLVGYRHGHQAGGPNRVTIGGGLTDHAFRLIPLLEAGKAGAWPWAE